MKEKMNMVIKKDFSHHRKLWIGISGLAVFICFVTLTLLFHKNIKVSSNEISRQSYALVSEKISQKAQISITLPDGIIKLTAKQSISFDPTVKGEWIETSTENQVVFKPAEPLTVGKFYSVNLDTKTQHFRDDFFVEENPAISAIFPSEGSEVNENSNITIIFNRPMVPLTTLSELDKKTIPITITPETEGRWKWISTRNLQFIPKERLIRSTKYTVNIGSGIVSMDGLPIPRKTAHFTTRPLHSVGITSGEALYRNPISIAFNQPVDLTRTFSEISVVNTANNSRIQIVAEYAKTHTYNSQTKKYEELDNWSIINIYQKADRLGREKLWDFNNNYRLELKKSYPQEGDVVLNQSQTSNIQVHDIISSFSATSKRSSQVRTDLFDPQGEIVVGFYEDIDRLRSKISAKGLTSIAYGEKCMQDEFGNALYLDSGECKKEENKKELVLHFDAFVFKLGESFSVDFESIINSSGLKVNAEKISKPVKIYPTLSVREIFPKEGEKKASLTDFIICSNTPIQQVPKEDYKKYITASDYLVFGSWEPSIYISTQEGYGYGFCKVGEFETKIRYGLHPEKKYTLTVKYEDEFFQKGQKTVSVSTMPAPSQYTRFYNMQKVYNVTSPSKTKLTYAVENLEFVNLNICKLTPEALFKATQKLVGNTEKPNPSTCSSVKTDVIQLPKRYWVNNYFQINLAKYFPDTIGHYIVTFSNPKYIDEYTKAQLYDRTYVSVTRLAVGEKKVQWNADYYSADRDQYEGRTLSGKLLNPGQNIYWVTRFNTLTPIVGAEISTYAYKKTATQSYAENGDTEFSSSIKTGADGIAKGEVVQNMAGVIVKYGADSTIVSPWADSLQYSDFARNYGKTLIYTDRPIYRPGQEVFFKGVDRVGYDGTFEIFREKNVKVKIYDSAGTSVYEQNLPISAYGTFSASIVLKNDAPLGTYRIEVFGFSAYFDVEEYVAAPFKVDVASAKEEYIAGDMMDLTVDAQYYFGVPVESAEVSYSVTSQDYYFDKYQDEYFNFGAGWYSCQYCGSGDRFVFRGTTKTDVNGKANIQKALDFSKLYVEKSAETSKIFVVDISVKDSNGRSISVQKSFIVHRGKIYIGVKTDQYSIPKNTPFTIRGKTVNTKGIPISVSSATLAISKITWEEFKRREVDGGFYYQSEQHTTLVKKETIQTDSRGNWIGSYSLAEEGQYEIKLSTKDSAGNLTFATTNMYVYGDGGVDIRSTNNYALEIETEKLDVSVGDKPKIIIKSPYKKAKALITTERGKVFEYQVIDINSNLSAYTIPIKAEYAPNIFVSVLLLSDGPEMKFGQVEFKVDAKQHKLNVDVSSDKKNYLPGEKVTLFVKTTNYLGEPVPAEVSLAVADLSILALKGNPKKNPLLFFYDGLPLTVTTSSNVKNILEEFDIPIGTKGGGGDPESLANRKRGIFKDTAFWQSAVVTDAKGKASVSFTLPDNLTTWQIESLGITMDTLIGVDYDEFITQKHIMTVPLKPRFVIPGDEFSIGAKIFNQSGIDANFDVSIQSDTLELSGEKTKIIFLESGKTQTVYFKAKAPAKMQEGLHTFTLSAKGNEGEDTVENTISITKNNTYETVATANFTKANTAQEFLFIPASVILDEGGLTINANATMAVFLGDALKYLEQYPYGCSEQLSSKLSSIGTIRRGMNIKNVGDKIKMNPIVFEGKTYTVEEAVKLGLGRLYQSQSSNGSFSYYPQLPPDIYLTLHVVKALENLREAGFDVNVDVINRASAFLYNSITKDSGLYNSNDLVILTAYTLSEVQSFDAGYKTKLKRMIKSIAQDKKYLNEDVSSLSLAYLAILTARGKYSSDISSTVFTTLENRIEIDGRGAYLKDNEQNNLSQFYETRAGDTALLLKAFVAQKYEDPLIDKILRWLLRSRDKDGAWGSTNATLTVIDAMTDYLNWQKETESNFTLTGTLDGKKVFGFGINQNTVLNTFTQFLPINTLPQNKLAVLDITKKNRNKLRNNFYYDMTLKYFLPADKIPARDEGITITRTMHEITDTKNKTPVKTAKIGQVLRGKLTIILPKAYDFVSVEDFIPAGFEIVNFNLSTADKTLLQNKANGEMGMQGSDGNADNIGYAPILLPSPSSQTKMEPKLGFFESIWKAIKELFAGKEKAIYRVPQSPRVETYDSSEKPIMTLVPDITESHDDRIFLFTQHMAPGIYEYEYYLRALVPGTFTHLPARAEEMYYPEIFGRTEGGYFIVENAE